MDLASEQRFQFLSKGEFVPEDYVRDYYGFEVPLAKETLIALTQYRRLLKRPAEPRPGLVSRYEIEGMMVRSSLLPKKWMGARLGMTVTTLDEMLDKLAEFGMSASRYKVGEELVVDSLSEELARHVPGLRFVTFSDHNSFCTRLHNELKKTGINVAPLFCETSVELNEQPRLFAMHFDCLTFEPISTKHSAWLDFGKPIILPPDRCSKLFYVKNRTELKEYAAGTTEPENLEPYQRFLAEGGNG